MRSRLHDEELTANEGAFNVLRLVVVDLFDVGADGADLVHEVLPEGLVQDQLLLVVADPELLLLVHRVAVEQTGAGETWQVFAV